MNEQQKDRIAGAAQLCEAYLHLEAAAVAAGDFAGAALYADSAEWASSLAFDVIPTGDHWA